MRNVALKVFTIISTGVVAWRDEASEYTASSNIVLERGSYIGGACCGVIERAISDASLLINGHASEINLSCFNITDKVVREGAVLGLVEANTDGPPADKSVVSHYNIF